METSRIALAVAVDFFLRKLYTPPSGLRNSPYRSMKVAAVDRSKSVIDVKLALAEKYERLSRLSGSRPRAKTLAGQALKYRRQAEQLSRTSAPAK